MQSPVQDHSPWQAVRDFEGYMARRCGSRYAVAVDCCTNAIFLCCKWHQVQRVTIPRRTYVSVPCSIVHAGGSVDFDTRDWAGDYTLEPYPIIDSACRLEQGMHVPGTFRCLSFNWRKHVKIGRGGMILHDDPAADSWFRLARYSGRREVPLMDDVPQMLGWPMYMLPEQAIRGLLLAKDLPEFPGVLQFEYPDLSKFPVYG